MIARGYYIVFIIICCAPIMCSIVIAMVIEAPTRTRRSIPSTTTYSPMPDITPTRRRSTRRHDRQFRIRRTQASDIDAASSMLASESIGVSQESTNWNDNINRLRAQSIIEKQLRYRLAAVEEGRNTAHRLKVHDNDNDEICNLWSNTHLRDKIQTASFLSQEESCWSTHDFALTPTSDMLNHVMMTAVSSSGEVVGFCEVAYLPSPPIGYRNDNDIQQQRIQVSNNSLDIPSSSSCEETPDSYCDILHDEITQQYGFDHQQQVYAQPAIVNLVTSSLHRRKGIASRIISFAKKYTSTQWKSSSCNTNNEISLGLYVHPENTALRLYEKKGFVLIPESEKADGNGLLYLSHRIRRNRLMKKL